MLQINQLFKLVLKQINLFMLINNFLAFTYEILVMDLLSVITFFLAQILTSKTELQLECEYIPHQVQF